MSALPHSSASKKPHEPVSKKNKYATISVQLVLQQQNEGLQQQSKGFSSLRLLNNGRLRIQKPEYRG